MSRQSHIFATFCRAYGYSSAFSCLFPVDERCGSTPKALRGLLCRRACDYEGGVEFGVTTCSEGTKLR